MNATPTYLTLLLAAGIFTALAAPPAASAVPVCTNTTPTTTQCERPGNAQIVTGPATQSSTGPFPEFPWGVSGVSVGIGGWGR